MRQLITGDPPTWVRMKQLENKMSPDKDFISDIDKRIESGTMPNIEEPCLCHPFNTSQIKIRNKGIIDMFVATNQGIRIDPGQKTVNMMTNGMKEHLGYFQAWVNEFAHWFVQHGVWFKVEQGGYRIDTKMETEIVAETYIATKSTDDTSIEAGTTLDTKSKENTNVYSEQDYNISAKENVNISGKEVQVSAGKFQWGGVTVSTVDDDADVLKQANEYTDNAISSAMDSISQMISDAVSSMGSSDV